MQRPNVQQIRKALIKTAWNSNANKPGVRPVLVVYPNDFLSELFGEKDIDKNWIPDDLLTTLKEKGVSKVKTGDRIGKYIACVGKTNALTDKDDVKTT